MFQHWRGPTAFTCNVFTLTVDLYRQTLKSVTNCGIEDIRPALTAPIGLFLKPQPPTWMNSDTVTSYITKTINYSSMQDSGVSIWIL